jgi:hypothetical protein
MKDKFLQDLKDLNVEMRLRRMDFLDDENRVDDDEDLALSFLI